METKRDKRFRTVDLPSKVDFAYARFDERTQRQIREMIERAHKNGRWRCTEDILFDLSSVEFWAYYLQKAADPIVNPAKGSGLKQHFSPFKKPYFDFRKPGLHYGTSYRLSAVGDLMCANQIYASNDRLYENVQDLIFGADCVFGNLESSISPAPPVGLAESLARGDTPEINLTVADYEALTQHKGRRYDVLQLANNHVLDRGEQGLMTNIEYLTRDGIDYIGVHRDEDCANTIRQTMVGDLCVGWIAHTFSVNDKPIPDDKPWIVDITPFGVDAVPDLSAIENAIAKARNEDCDLIVLALHWGAEWEFYPSPQQLEWAHRFAELGADAIIGTHPHVIQPVEIYAPSSAPGKQVPIIYSLGNLTPVLSNAYTTLSLVANLTLAKCNGRASITSLSLTPVVFLAEEDDDQLCARVVPLKTLFDAELDETMRDYVDTAAHYADLAIGPEWRHGIRCRR